MVELGLAMGSHPMGFRSSHITDLPDCPYLEIKFYPINTKEFEPAI